VEERRVAADLGIGEIEAARQVTGSGALDLDHPGAEILQAQRTVGARKELAEIDHQKACEGGRINFSHLHVRVSQVKGA
jgi:hypothetical protein